MINVWSYSGLKLYDKCPYAAKLRYVEGHRSTTVHPAAQRGIDIHQAAEDYVRGEISTLPQSLSKCAERIEWYREAFAEGQVELEGDWGFDVGWGPTGWWADNVWARIKLDVFLRDPNGVEAEVADYKTGKLFGNEVAHLQQGQIYTVAAFMKHPELEVIRRRFIYLDHGKETLKTYNRDEAMQFLPRWNNRALAMTSANEFPAKPNKFNCKWCDYRPDEGGQCTVGLSNEELT